jgi:hypothetical protein
MDAEGGEDRRRDKGGRKLAQRRGGGTREVGN